MVGSVPNLLLNILCGLCHELVKIDSGSEDMCVDCSELCVLVAGWSCKA